MKRVFIAVIAVAFLLCGCDSQNTESAYPQINKTQLELTVGQSERLIVSNAENIVWSCSNTGVVRVFYGAVTALAEGTAVVTADADGQIFECVVTVRQGETEAQTESAQQSASSLPQTSSNTQQVSSVEESSTTETDTQSAESQSTHQQNVEATQSTASELIERIINNKYDEKIAELQAEYDKLAETNEQSIKELELQLESVEKDSGEEFLIKDAIKTIQITLE